MILLLRDYHLKLRDISLVHRTTPRVVLAFCKLLVVALNPLSLVTRLDATLEKVSVNGTICNRVFMFKSHIALS